MTTPARLSSALVDRYCIERELGQGGMATVYLAEDLRHKRKLSVADDGKSYVYFTATLAAVLGRRNPMTDMRPTADA